MWFSLPSAAARRHDPLGSGSWSGAREKSLGVAVANNDDGCGP